MARPLEWLLSGTGPLATNGVNAGGYCRSDVLGATRSTNGTGNSNAGNARNNTAGNMNDAGNSNMGTLGDAGDTGHAGGDAGNQRGSGNTCGTGDGAGDGTGGGTGDGTGDTGGADDYGVDGGVDYEDLQLHFFPGSLRDYSAAGQQQIRTLKRRGSLWNLFSSTLARLHVQCTTHRVHPPSGAAHEGAPYV